MRTIRDIAFVLSVMLFMDQSMWPVSGQFRIGAQLKNRYPSTLFKKRVLPAASPARCGSFGPCLTPTQANMSSGNSASDRSFESTVLATSMGYRPDTFAGVDTHYSGEGALTADNSIAIAGLASQERVASPARQGQRLYKLLMSGSRQNRSNVDDVYRSNREGINDDQLIGDESVVTRDRMSRDEEGYSTNMMNRFLPSYETTLRKPSYGSLDTSKIASHRNSPGSGASPDKQKSFNARDELRSYNTESEALVRSRRSLARSQLTRQVDILHSCIEAKCSGWAVNYIDCVFRHCVENSHHGHAYLAKRQVKAHDNSAMKGASLYANRRFSRHVNDRAVTSVLKQAKEGDNQRNRDVFDRYSASAMTSQEEGPGARQEFRSAMDRRYPNSFPADMGLGERENALTSSKRGYNDIADMCVRHHCGEMAPSSLLYFKCREDNCAGQL